MTTTMRRVELGVLIALLLLAGVVVWQAVSMPAGTVSLPGPGMVPAALGVLLGLSVLALLPSCLRPGAGRDDRIAFGDRRIAAAVLYLLGAGFLLERAGFVLTSTLFLFATLWTLSPLGWWRSLTAAAVASGLAAYLFGNLLGVSLPPLPWRL